jgi:hypothetical protein
MVKDKRQGWLKELKEGDEVFIVGVDTDSYEETEIGTVTHITPTGRIGVNYTQYSVEGYRKHVSYPTRLKKLTPEAKKEYLLEKERQEYLKEAQRTVLLIKTREALSKLNLNKLNTRELQALYDCIKFGND